MDGRRLDELFRQRGFSRDLAGGGVLLRAGGPAHSLYRLVSGRLATLASTDAGAGRILELHRPGALFAGAQYLTGESHPATIVSLRDSEIHVLRFDQLDPVVRSDPRSLAELARASLRRQGSDIRPIAGRGTILGLVAVCDSVVMRALAEDLASSMRRLGLRVAVLGEEAHDCGPARLSNLEDAHDFVLLAAERSQIAFTEFCGRQIDRLILVGGAGSPLPEPGFRFAALAIQRHRLVDLVLIQPTDVVRPSGSARWVSGAPTSRLFHIRQGSRADLDRLGRTFAGRSLGVAFSGGGARAYAHVGVIRALGELGVPIDAVAGTSMGAVIAAGLAMGWDQDELDARIRDAFVRSSPLADIAFPLLAMCRGQVVTRRLADHFGEAHIADLWKPFACASTNLTKGELKVHRSGVLAEALRASISLPGVLPPVVADGEVLVDGALVRNLPGDLVRELHDGPVIGVDVAGAMGLMPEELMLRPPGLRWLSSGAWLKGPPIVSVLIRSATLPTARAATGSPQAVDMLIEPALGGIQLRDWKAYDTAVEVGYRATMAKAQSVMDIVSGAVSQ